MEKNKLFFTKFIKNSLEPFLTFHSFHQYVLFAKSKEVKISNHSPHNLSAKVRFLGIFE